MLSPSTLVEILRFGGIGLAFLLAFLAYRLIAKEAAKPPEEARPKIVRTIWGFMVLAGVLAVVGVASELIHRSGERENVPESVLDDAAFWRAVYDSLPPSFIKRYAPNEEHLHLTDNHRLRRFQGADGPGSVDPEIERLIKEDHERGDLQAYQTGLSFQLEYSDPGPGRSPQPIFTRKMRVDYGEEQYIVGMYVPVEIEMAMAPSFCMKVNSTLPMLGLTLGGQTDQCVEVKVGEALLAETQSDHH